MTDDMDKMMADFLAKGGKIAKVCKSAKGAVKPRVADPAPITLDDHFKLVDKLSDDCARLDMSDTDIDDHPPAVRARAYARYDKAVKAYRTALAALRAHPDFA